jgi:Flp pilus assembly protein TadD
MAERRAPWVLGVGDWELTSSVTSGIRSLTRAVLAAALLTAVGAQSPADPPDEARRRNNLGVALMDAGTKDPKYFAEAVREFEGALQLSPRYPIARLNLGLALYYAGQTARADAVLGGIARERPGERHAEYVSGLIREYEGRFDSAAAHFRRVAQADRDDADVWYHLGFCLGRAGKPQEAVGPLRRAAAIVPYQRRVRYGLYMALTRAGRAQEAQEELERFRALDNSQIRVVEGPKNTLEYLKQGRYAEAIPDSRHVAPRPAPPRYTDATASVGLAAASAQPDAALDAMLRGEAQDARLFTTPATRARMAAALGVGAAFVDVDKDGRLDVAWVRGGALALFVQAASGRFTRVPLQARALVPNPTAIAAGDLDNDGWTDLVVGGPGRLVILQNRGSMTAEKRGQSAFHADLTRDVGTVRIFREWRPPKGPGSLNRLVPRTASIRSLTLADIDHDGDLDIVAAGGVSLDRPRANGRVRYPDDFAAASNLVLRNNANGSFADVSRESGMQATGATRGFWFSDLDDDHAIDAVAVDEHGGSRVFLNRKDGSFAAAPSIKAPDAPRAGPGESRAYGDYDGDGAVDELVVQRGGVRLNRNSTAPAHWLTVRTAGYALPGKVKSNTLGIGARVEVRTAGRWERREIRAGNGAGGSDAPEATFALGSDTALDFVRAVFPSGVRRTLTSVKANQAIRIEEPLLDVNSCPTLFTWDGQRFRFITDTISAGILGELVAPGQYWSPDPDEWVRMDGDALVPREGTLDVRFTNPLEETTYLDAVRLLAVDHPDDLDVYSDDRMLGAAETRQPIRLYAVRGRRAVASAFDHHGHDVTAALAALDRRYFDHFAPQPFKGFAGDWSLTIDIGRVAAGSRPVLGLYGWSYWNSSAAIVAAAQADEALWGPELDVRGVDGRWRRATDDMGLPAGLPRTILIDLSSSLRPGEHVVRIRANRTLLFDQAWVADAVWSGALGASGEAGPTGVTEPPLATADLRWLGYPRRNLPDGRLPEVFDYDEIEHTAEWRTAAGLLTRYGAVNPLLAAVDDRFVVMGHGEEIALRFDAASVPQLRPGWRRTWFFFADGFEKGNELYSAHGDTVAPLPYHAMRSYGDEETPAAGPASAFEYLLDWNTRPSFVRGRR